MQLSDVVTQVSLAIQDADFDRYGLKVLQIELALKTQSAKTAGAEFSILEVLEIGAEVKQDRTSIVTFAYEPVPMKKHTSFAPSLAEDLRRGIQMAAEGLQQSVDALPGFEMKTTTLEVAFTISAEGGFKAVAKGGASGSEEHSVKLTLGVQ